MDKNSDKYQSLFICLTLALITLAVFHQVGSFGFIDIDDPEYVWHNQNIQAGFTVKAVNWAFSTGCEGSWHPVTWLSHTLDWRLFGADAGGHHLTNLIFHIANTLILFLVLRRMTGAVWQSAFVAVLFALHPLHVESVAWVSERKDVLSSFFWLLTMWAYVRFVSHPKIINYLLIVLFFALGLMSKPMLVTLPFVLLLLDYWPLERKISHKLLIEKIPLFAMALTLSAVTFITQKKSGMMRIAEDFSFPVRAANAFISYMQYIIKMIWPADLSYFYLHPGQDVSYLYAVISAAILLAITILVLRFGKKHRYLVPGWLWYLGTLVPVIGFIQVGIQARADRYSYITLIGLFIIIAWGIPELLAKWRYRKIAMRTSSLTVLIVLAAVTYFQTGYWKDSITLYEHSLKVTADNWKVHMDLAQALLKQKRIDESIRSAEESVKLKPACTDAINVLGVVYYYAGRTDDAVEQFNRALQINPQYKDARKNLDIALAKKQKTQTIEGANNRFETRPILSK